MTGKLKLTIYATLPFVNFLPSSVYEIFWSFPCGAALMNQLNGKYVNVVLSVEDGRELDFVKHRVHLSANFSGRILESDSVLPEESTPFNTELIWEIEKKDLRKIRTINQLLRLECISTDSYNRRERIGFVLFSLRSAQIVPSKEPNIPVRFKWHKLVGCQADKKKFHPELYVALTVRDHLPNQEENIKPHNAPLISEQDVVEQLELPSECYVKYLDDGYIQIGTGDYPESYSLNLLIEEAKNLDALLPEEMVFKENPEKLHMSFTIFGVTIKTKPFYKQVDGVTNLNEKVVVRLLSNEQTLFDFFVNQCVTISIFSGRDMLGVAKVNLRAVNFKEISAVSHFTTLTGKTSIEGNESPPSIQIHMWLKREFHPISEELKSPRQIISNLYEPMSIACSDRGDEFILDNFKQVYTKSNTEAQLVTDCPQIIKSVDTVVKSAPLSPRCFKKYDVLGTYAAGILEVSLKSLEWKSRPQENIIIFRFLHPRASSYITILTHVKDAVGEMVDLNCLGVKIGYVAEKDVIESTLNAWPPKLVLTDENDKLLSMEVEFRTTNFFTTSDHAYTYATELKTTALQPLALLQVTLKFELSDLSALKNAGDWFLRPPILDEMLSVKELADIESWKNCRKEIFDAELIKFKEDERARLESVFEDKKRELENKWWDCIEKCQNLKRHLQLKLNEMKTAKYVAEKRRQADTFEDVFAENWHTFELKDKTDVIEELSRTQRDNEYLRKLVADQRDELRSLRRTTLIKRNSASLLEDLEELEKQFGNLQRSKKDFVEQWTASCDYVKTDIVIGEEPLGVGMNFSDEESSSQK